MEIIFKKESKHEGNDCMIYESAFVVEVEHGYVATKNTIYHGWMNFYPRSQSFVFDNADDAIAYTKSDD